MRTEQTLQTGVLVVFIILAAGCGAPTTAETTAGPVEREQESSASLSSKGWGDGAAEAMVRRPVAYLEEVIPPCVPVEGSGLDPCSPIQLSAASQKATATVVPTTMLHTLPSFNDVFLGILDSRSYPNLVPHMVIRGVAKPDTTRCAEYPVKLFNYEHSSDLYNYSGRAEGLYLDTYFYYCFLDFRISEYIVGEGPPVLTISVNTGAIFPSDRSYIDDNFYRSQYLKAE